MLLPSVLNKYQLYRALFYFCAFLNFNYQKYFYYELSSGYVTVDTTPRNNLTNEFEGQFSFFRSSQMSVH